MQRADIWQWVTEREHAFHTSNPSKYSHVTDLGGKKSLHLVNKSLQVIAFNFSPHKLDLCLAYTNNFKFLSHCYAAHATFPQDE